MLTNEQKIEMAARAGVRMQCTVANGEPGKWMTWGGIQSETDALLAAMDAAYSAGLREGIDRAAAESDRQAEDEPYGHAKFRCANIAAAIRAQAPKGDA